MSEAKKVYALIESWNYHVIDVREFNHRAFWLSYPTVEQVWAVFDLVDRIWYTKEIVEKIVAGEYVDHDFEKSSVIVFIAEYEISE